MSIVELYDIVKTELVTDLVRNTFGSMCENIFEFSLDVISEKNPKTNHREINRYFYTVYLLKLDQEGAQGTKVLNIVRNSLTLFEMLEGKEQALAQLYDDLLLNEILACEKLEELLEWVQIANSLLDYTKNPVTLPAAYNRFVPLAYQEMSNLSVSPSGKGHINIIENIKKGLDYQLSLQSVAALTIGNSLDFIEQRNGFYPYDINIEKNPAEDWEIIEVIEDVMRLNSQDPEQQKIEDDFLKESFIQVKSKLESILPYAEYKAKRDHVGGKKILINDEEADFNILFEDLTIEKYPIDASRTDKFQTSIFKGKINIDRGGVKINENVGIKMYQEIELGTDFRRVFQEINIYKRLSDLKDWSKNCFTKYYGTCKTVENGKVTYYMVMEYQERDLSKLLMEDAEISDQLLKKMFSQLIRSFDQMHSLGIYHLDIKPANILIDGNFNMSIIDFDIAIMKKAGRSSISDQSNRSAGTWGYADPKIQASLGGVNVIGNLSYNCAAADVFSLGMTLFHILVKNNFEITLNTFERNDELLDKVRKLKEVWARDLLLNMLNKDENMRRSFRDLAKNFEGISTKPYSTKDY